MVMEQTCMQTRAGSPWESTAWEGEGEKGSCHGGDETGLIIVERAYKTNIDPQVMLFHLSAIPARGVNESGVQETARVSFTIRFLRAAPRRLIW